MELRIKNLSKTYPNGVRALRGLNLSINKGMFGLLGQNGAGKSSLMRTLATLQDVDEGTVSLGDIDVLNDPLGARRVIGYLPQTFGVYDTVSAWEMLDYVANIKGVTRKKQRQALVESLLRQVNLFDVRKNRLSTYSGGMKQRFGIAQALIGNPRLIIVDEPTAGLDPVERKRFYNILSRLGERAIVILSTHIVEDVTSLCQDVAIMGRGRVLTRGTPEEIMEGVRGKIWRREIHPDELPEYEDRFLVTSTRIHQGRITVDVYDRERPGTAFKPKAPDLEDAYFAAIHPGTGGPDLEGGATP